MKRVLIIFITICLATASFSNDKTVPKLTGPYLGQKPPGNTPELFAPGIVSSELNTRDFASMPDGKEIYFCANLANFTFATILVTREVNGRWTRPEVMEQMEDPGCWNIEPCISADGNKFFFMSNRPDKTNNEVKGDSDIWVMDRICDKWGEPYNLGMPVNSESAETYPSVTRDGTLYFTRKDEKSGAEYIYRSRLLNGKYQEPEKLPVQVNSGRTQFNAFIAPDESYIIVPVYGRKDSLGSIDYYIVFRNQDDSWSEPVNMGPAINTADGNEYSSSVSPDGKYLFFMSSRILPKEDWPEKLTIAILHNLQTRPGNGNSSIYWVSTRIIDELRPKDLK